MSKNNENKLVPIFRFPEFKNEEEWRYPNGNELFEPIVNKNHNSDLPILAITQEQGAIPRNLIDYHVSVTDKSVESYKVVEVGDFIISLRSFQGGIEYSGYKGLCSPAYIILRKKTDLESDFYRHYFKSMPFIRDLNKNLEGIRDGKMISYKQFSEIRIPKPNHKEQQKIASCLSSLDDVMKTESEKLDIILNHKKGLLQNLLPKEGESIPNFRFKEFENSGVWVEKELGSFCNSLSSGKDKNVEDGEYELYGSTGIIGKAENANYEGDFILVARVGANAGLLNKVTGKFGVTDNTLVIDLIKKNIINFIYYSLENVGLKELVFGSGQPLITGGQLKSLQFLIPQDEKEQVKIADTLSSVDDLINAQNQKLEALQLHKRGLLQGLFPNLNDVTE